MSTEHAKENVTEAHTSKLSCRIFLQLPNKDQINGHYDVIDDCGNHGGYGDLDELFRHFAFAEHFFIVLVILRDIIFLDHEIVVT